MFFHSRRRTSRSRARGIARVAVAIIIGFPFCAGAQGVVAPSRDTLSLGDVLALAQRASPRIDAARAGTHAAEARIPGASRWPDPTLQFGFMNYELPGLRPMDVVGMRQLQLMQTVPTGGKLRIAGAVERARADAASTRIDDASLQVRAQAAMAFYDLYAADRGLIVARESRRVLEDINATAASMYEAGDGRQADVLRARVELARMDEDIVRMETMRSATAARLNALLGRTSDTNVGTPALSAFLASVPPLDSLDAMADRHRPALRAAGQEVVAATSSAELARRQIWPDLQVGVQLARQPGAGTKPMASLMFGASLPIFAKDRQYQMRDEADAMRAMAAADLATMRIETRADVADAFTKVMRARRLIELYRSTVLPQSQASAASSLAAYRSSTVNLMTLLDAQMTVKSYRQDLITLEADEGKAWAELEMLTGCSFVGTSAKAPVCSSAGGSQ